MPPTVIKKILENVSSKEKNDMEREALREYPRKAVFFLLSQSTAFFVTNLLIMHVPFVAVSLRFFQLNTTSIFCLYRYCGCDFK
mmetsp:Transcript_25515/g.59794  ORF Transcript_25515/g.59794 Transcript_25515/m.59794 type:complete len:84 (-) Transcript_25515:356-607(-)